MTQHETDAELERLLRTTGTSPSVGFTDRLFMKVADTPQQESSKMWVAADPRSQSRSGAAWIAEILLDPLILGSTAAFAVIALGSPLIQPLLESAFLFWPRWISFDPSTSWTWSLWGLCAAAAMLALMWSIPRLFEGASPLPPENSLRRLVK